MCIIEPLSLHRTTRELVPFCKHCARACNVPCVHGCECETGETFTTALKIVVIPDVVNDWRVSTCADATPPHHALLFVCIRQDLVSRLTLDEKLGLLGPDLNGTGVSVCTDFDAGVPRLGIPGYVLGTARTPCPTRAL